MSDFGLGSQLSRRSMLLGAAGALGAVAAGPATGWGPRALAQDHPPNWPPVRPYGTADTRVDLEPRSDNSRILELQKRPRDEEFGRLWIRDVYVNHFTVDGRSVYVATGTTRVAKGLSWNDGIFVWVADSLEGPWELVDTTGIRPDVERGKVWSPEFVGENDDERTVVAPWQEYEGEGEDKRGDVWAPEVHYFQGNWYIVACMGDHSRKVGSFLLISEGGLAGPYRVAKGNREKPFGDRNPGVPDGVDRERYYHIDGGLHTEGDKAWLVLHNDLYAEFQDDMEDLVQKTNLPRFRQKPYDPEPYLEGAHVIKYEGKYYLVHAVWNKLAGGRRAYTPEGEKRRYNAVIAVSDTFEGPYSERWTGGIDAGHNNLFVDADGTLWATFFRNPTAGYWSEGDRVDEAAVPGIVRMEWTGPQGNRVYVERRS